MALLSNPSPPLNPILYLLRQGEQLTRNCIGAAVTAPLEIRREAVMEERGYR